MAVSKKFQKQQKITKSSKTGRISEFTSYIFIKKELERLGWNTKNPERNIEGQVYTQQECLDNKQIQKCFGKKRPEYVIKLTEDSYYIIEAKPLLSDIDLAYEEALGYAELINKKNNVIKAKIISGVAGNDEDGYQIKSAFF